jgi:N-acyl homoserine lactone hydrolase
MLREVRMLRSGSCLIDQSELVTGTPEGTMVLIPIWTYLLRGDDAIFLVDTGMPSACIGNERFFAGVEGGDHILPQMEERDTVQEVLARQELSIADLDGLISTHWHFDHAGGNRHFHGCPVLVHPDEVTAYRAEPQVPDWVDLALDFHPVRDGDQPMPGVTLLHTPGHTPGHLSLLLEPHGEGPLLLTIDATYTRRNWEESLPGAMVDPALGMRSVERLKEIAHSHGANVFFGHDARQADEEFWQQFAR